MHECFDAPCYINREGSVPIPCRLATEDEIAEYVANKLAGDK
jgi:hypothetical protein